MSAQPAGPLEHAFLTAPWWAMGHAVEGHDAPRINETATRARAGLLNAVSAVTWRSCSPAPSSTRCATSGPFVLFDMLAAAAVGLTPLSPTGLLGTALTLNLRPTWKPTAPKRFAWLLGAGLAATCLSMRLAGASPGSMAVVVATCFGLTWLEARARLLRRVLDAQAHLGLRGLRGAVCAPLTVPPGAPPRRFGRVHRSRSGVTGTTTFGKYELISLLSVGGMAEVHLALHHRAGRLPEVRGGQAHPPRPAGRPAVRADVQTEARVTAALLARQHRPGLRVRCRSTARSSSSMEFIHGIDLVKAMRRTTQKGERVPQGLALKVVHDLCLALHYAHTFVDAAGQLKRPVVHRDVTPRNVMLSHSRHAEDHRLRHRQGGRHGLATPRSATCAGASATWRPSRFSASRWTAAPTSSARA